MADEKPDPTIQSLAAELAALHQFVRAIFWALPDDGLRAATKELRLRVIGAEDTARDYAAALFDLADGLEDSVELFIADRPDPNS